MLRRSLKIFVLFSKFSLKTTFQARAGVIFFMIGKILRFLLYLSLIFIVLGKTKIIKGYGLNQAVVFYLTFNIVDTAGQILFREVYRFRQLVVSGNLDLVLTKPYHPFLKILVGGVDFLDLVLLIPYIGLAVWFAHITNLFSLTLYFLLILNALIITTAFHIIVLGLGILTTSVDHTMMIYRDITTLGRFPIDIYREPIKGIFTFIIPIGIMMSFPPKALFNLLSPLYIAYAFMLSFAIFWFSLWFWNYAIKKYQSAGG